MREFAKILQVEAQPWTKRRKSFELFPYLTGKFATSTDGIFNWAYENGKERDFICSNAANRYIIGTFQLLKGLCLGLEIIAPQYVYTK